MQCRACRHRASLTAGTMMDSTKLPPRKWFLAMYLISQAKTGLSALALMRQLGVSYRSACVTDRRNRATDVRHIGASNRWVNGRPEGVTPRVILQSFGGPV